MRRLFLAALGAFAAAAVFPIRSLRDKHVVDAAR